VHEDPPSLGYGAACEDEDEKTRPASLFTMGYNSVTKAGGFGVLKNLLFNMLIINDL
jgi:hypothetical protein